MPLTVGKRSAIMRFSPGMLLGAMQNGCGLGLGFCALRPRDGDGSVASDVSAQKNRPGLRGE